MDPTFRAICFTVALILFVLDYWVPRSLVPAGLAAAVLPFAWDAWEAA